MVRVYVSGLRAIAPESLRSRVFGSALLNLLERGVGSNGRPYASFSVAYDDLEGTPAVRIEYPDQSCSAWAERIRTELSRLFDRCPFENRRPTLEVKPV